MHRSDKEGSRQRMPDWRIYYQNGIVIHWEQILRTISVTISG
jgi:hypothetical protein